MLNLSKSRSNSAFTLIELLVVIGILSVLLATLLPAIAHTRESARLVVGMQFQNQVGLNLSLYLHDNNEAFPYWGKPGTNDADLVYHGKIIYTDAHWAHPYAWGMFIEDRGYDGASSSDSGIGYRFGGPDRTQEDLDRFFVSLHNITHAAYAEPAYFNGDLQSQTIDQLRVLRNTDAAFPSQKGMLWASTAQLGFRDSSSVRAPYLVTFCDLHSELPDRNTLRPPIEHSIGWSFPFAATKDGMLGRDI